jgi:hypothetical protein
MAVPVASAEKALASKQANWTTDIALAFASFSPSGVSSHEVRLVLPFIPPTSYPGGSQLVSPPPPPLYCVPKMSCPSDNTQVVDQSSFWSSGNINWDAHRIGWAIAGGSTFLVSAITPCPKKPRVYTAHATADCHHLCHYCSQSLPVCHDLAFDIPRASSHGPVTIPSALNSDKCTPIPSRLFCSPLRASGVFRIRILYMPPVYAVVSFFSYRFFRDYTYYSLGETSALAPPLYNRVLAHSPPLPSLRGAWQTVNPKNTSA